MEGKKEQEEAVRERPVVESSSFAFEAHNPSSKKKKNKKKKKKKIDTSQGDTGQVDETGRKEEEEGEQEEEQAVEQPPEQDVEVAHEVSNACEQGKPPPDKGGIKVREVPSSYLSDAAKAWGGIPVSLTEDETFKTVERFIPYDILKDMRAEDGLDMTKKEYYLEPEEFSKVFGLDMQAYLRLPLWRRQMLKKKVGLF